MEFDQETTFGSLLIIDDDAGDRALIKCMLADIDSPVLEASTGKRGLEIAEARPLDCVIVDYNLPDISGMDLVEQLRWEANDPFLPVILLTGHGDETLVVEALHRGASDYMRKDKANRSSLSRSIANALTQASLSRSLGEERRKLELMNRELIRANHEISSFYQTVSHELKTPLTAIREFTSIMLDAIGGPINAKQRKFLTTSLHCCDTLTGLVSDLFDTARIATGRLAFDFESAAINPVIEECVELATSSACQAGIEIETKLTNVLPDVFADESRIGQVVNNLLTNAIRFTPGNGKIVITSWLAGSDEVAVAVRDTGRGIEAGFCERIFDRFAQAQPADSSSHEGMGIGLYLCANIIENHHGNISVASKLGQGSTFKLPIAVSDHL
ncbi:MAG: hybrid sensor histidine kinase/response regulator [Pseudomonadales bacterium]|jgi:signal transduction histidine kinase